MDTVEPQPGNPEFPRSASDESSFSHCCWGESRTGELDSGALPGGGGRWSRREKGKMCPDWHTPDASACPMRVFVGTGRNSPESQTFRR
ncbi:hypothetical protein Zmor_023955 [Zophobas morio]|uniref:Uncharacterized protein n=1 Tax=Zophobas morio TaxID=2755281 RepID=A0AA38HZM0_9CUCU|nr:hypothetical protein Zmor_023955 [Zophobas morio]